MSFGKQPLSARFGSFCSGISSIRLFLVDCVDCFDIGQYALTTYGIGYFGNSLCKTHFKGAYEKLYRYENGIQKRGFIYAFFSFLPFVGDVFALGLGVYKYSWLKAIIFIALGKGVRYLFVIAMYLKYQAIF